MSAGAGRAAHTSARTDGRRPDRADTARSAASLGAPMENGRPKALYEPVHGSAPDIAGQGIANPVASVWTAAMMLEHLGETAAGAQIESAIATTLGAGEVRTKDMGGSNSTDEMGMAVVAAMRNSP